MTGDDDMIANAGFGLAIRANTGNTAGIGAAKTLLIPGRCHGTGAGNGIFQGIANLIHAGNDQNILRAADNGRDPVAVTVNVDHLAIQAQTVGTGEEIIRKMTFPHGLFPLFGCGATVTVNGTIITLMQRIDQEKEIVRMGGDLSTDYAARVIKEANLGEKPNVDWRELAGIYGELRYKPQGVSDKAAFKRSSP